MAVRFLVVYIVLVVALSLVTEDISDCRNGFHAKAASPEKQIRKLLVDGSSSEVFKSLGAWDRGDEKEVVGWGLRAVPSGPDPLHHNGSGPKKPRTP